MGTLVEDGQAIWQAALRSVRADQLLAGLDLEAVLQRPLGDFRRIRVVGAGKAAMAMAGSLERQLLHEDVAGHVAVPHGYISTFPAAMPAPVSVRVFEAGHPVPDAAGLRAARHALETAWTCGPGDLLVVLVSGGGSALWFAPAVRPEALQELTRLLLRCGASIHEINSVRKHCSRIKGGRLAVAAHPASVLTLAVSDVIGDDLTVIASGPAVADTSSKQDALRVVQAHGIWSRLSADVRHLLEEGEETPSPGDPRLAGVQAALLGTNARALRAAHGAACALGYAVRIRSGCLAGEACVQGKAIAQAVATAAPGTCLLWGGETTVTVTGDGVGGRNQELALAAALELDGSRTTALVLSGGTDGIDGPTDAAGAWATPETAAEGRARGVDAAAFLRNNDAYGFFSAVPGILRMGPTHTNVMDIVVGLRGVSAQPRDPSL